MTVAQRVRRLAVERGGLLALASLALYLSIAARHLDAGDNSELATIGTLGGVPHPSGYPLYVLWLRLMSWLPGATPAHTAALATALLGAATMLVLHAACRAWGARPLAATVAVAIYAASPVVLRIFTEAEVFALNGLVVSTVLWLSARGGPLRGVARVAALGLVAGLGLSNHLTCVLVAPVGLLGAVRGVREASIPRVASVALAIGMFGAGLLPYLYFLIAPDTAISWRHMDGVGDLVHHLLRLDYGIGTLSPNRAAVATGTSIDALVEMLGRTWLWILLLLGVGALGLRIARPSADGETRWGWGLLAASFVLAGPVLISRFNIPPSGIGLVLVHRFHLLPALILAVPVAAGLDWIGTLLQARVSTRARGALGLGTALTLVVFVALASRSLPDRSAAVERGVTNMLAPLPPGAVVIVSEDDLYFGAAYVQLTRGYRPDITVISFGQLMNPEYRRRLHERSGVVMLTPGDRTPSIRIATDVLARGGGMFVDGAQTNILSTFPSYPYGSLFWVLPLGAPRPPIEDVFALNKGIYENFDLDYPAPARGDDYAAHVHERYVYIWRIIQRALAATGHRNEATMASEIANTLAPR